ncbi:MAG: type II toxin-antitoxin system RelB/DinJ family antitoxin [Oscillibacter sp.]|nr:type II toxin-antitoxin system RelB/DinJ family antitoxin [Oscillibacter sp.]MBQ7680907.1 type II toxin-antitoxin system RelB/DinJ family antitoxin [Oscillibacter sp.]MBQ9618328.1 type II toxin-antitoxin system RelB/DinJ family antitoxin [Oscillibacter sp.]
MSENAYSIQVDPALAREAQAVLRRLGMDVSSAVSIFLRDMVRNNGEPFRARNPEQCAGEIPNDETLAAFAELDNGGGKWFDGSTEDYIAKLLEDEAC